MHSGLTNAALRFPPSSAGCMPTIALYLASRYVGVLNYVGAPQLS